MIAKLLQTNLNNMYRRSCIRFPVLPGSYVAYAASEEVFDCLNVLADRAEALDEIQMRHGLTFPVGLESGTCALVEAWAQGEQWNELMSNTSLDPGDVFRILRRTIELLRQVSC